MLVVLPTPLTPIIRMISGVLSQSFWSSPLSIRPSTMDLIWSFTSSGLDRRCCLISLLSCSVIFMVVSMPMSEVISASSSSSIISSSMEGRMKITSSTFSFILPKKDFLTPKAIAFFSFYRFFIFQSYRPYAETGPWRSPAPAWLHRTERPRIPWLPSGELPGRTGSL